MIRRSLTAGLVAGSFLLAGCGGSDADGPAAKAAKDESPACAGTRLVFTDKATGDSTTLEKGVGVSLADGSAYTLYASDFPIALDDLSYSSTPTIPADGSMATIALTVFNASETPGPIEAGTTIPYSDDFDVLTFRVLQNRGTDMLNSSGGATGSVTVDAVGDTVCLTVEYSDDQKSYAGTVEAAVKPL